MKTFSIFSLCKRFVQVNTFCEKLAHRLPYCEFHREDELEVVIEKVRSSGGAIFFEVLDVQDLHVLEYLNTELEPQLLSGSVALMTISRLQENSLQKKLSAWPLAFLFKSTVSQSDFEPKMDQILRRNGFETPENKKKSGASGSENITLSYSRQKAQDSYHFKGKPTATAIQIEERMRGANLLSKDEGPAVRKPRKIDQMFQSITTREKKQKLLVECSQSRARVVMSHSDCQIRIEGLFHDFDEAAGEVRFTIKSNAELLGGFLATLDGQKIIFAAGLLQSRLFMAAPKFKIHEGHTTSLIFEIPEEMYMVQRRGNFRSVLFPGSPEYASFQWPETTACAAQYPLYDISPGGMALIVPESALAQFRRVDSILNLSLALNDKALTVPEAKRRHITAYPFQSDSLFFRIGFEFFGLTEDSKVWLEHFVGRELQSYFERYLASDPKG